MDTHTHAKMPYDMAEQEVLKWTASKGYFIDPDDDEMKQVKTLAKHVQRGTLVINEDMSITHKLMIPIGENDETTEINYRARITAREFEVKSKSANTNSPMTFVFAKIAAIANVNTGIIAKMDSTDFNISQEIAGFF